MNWLRTLIFTLLAPGLVWVLIPWMILRASRPAAPERLGAQQRAGALLALIGFSIYAWTASDFVRVGKGTPAPVFPTQRLVVTGLYRYVRNPMYLGVLTAIFGEVSFFQSPWLLLYAGIFWLVVTIFVILYEEPTLQKSFREAYAKYRRNVRRWIPRLTPYDPDSLEN